MERYYTVAGLTFAVELPDGFPLWEQMSNYEPFEVPSCDGGTIFRLSLTNNIEGLEEREALYVEDADEKDQPRVELYRRGEDWIFDMAPVQYVPICVRVEANADFTVGRMMLLGKTSLRTAMFALNNALMLMYAFRTATLGVLEMHASVIVNDGRGYLFLGKSGTGKSTHSSLWLKHIEGSRLLNDDNPIVRVLPDGTVRVYGSPWSGKTPCYINDSAPVGAFVRLKQFPQNLIAGLSIPEAYATIYSSSSGYKFDAKMADGLYETTAAIVTSVPCFELKCLPDEAAAILSSTTIKAAKGVEL